MLQATMMLPCRRQHVSSLKVAFNIIVESQSSRMLHVAYVALVQLRLYKSKIFALFFKPYRSSVVIKFSLSPKIHLTKNMEKTICLK